MSKQRPNKEIEVQSDKARSKSRSKNRVDIRINGKCSVILHCVKTRSERRLGDRSLDPEDNRSKVRSKVRLPAESQACVHGYNILTDKHCMSRILDEFLTEPAFTSLPRLASFLPSYSYEI
jgi:hypothetical protein